MLSNVHVFSTWRTHKSNYVLIECYKAHWLWQRRCSDPRQKETVPLITPTPSRGTVQSGNPFKFEIILHKHFKHGYKTCPITMTNICIKAASSDLWKPPSWALNNWLTYETLPCSVLTELPQCFTTSTLLWYSHNKEIETRSKSLNLHVRCLESSSWTVVLFIELCTPLEQQKINVNTVYWILTGSFSRFKPPSIVQARVLLVAI